MNHYSTQSKKMQLFFAPMPQKIPPKIFRRNPFLLQNISPLSDMVRPVMLSSKILIWILYNFPIILIQLMNRKILKQITAKYLNKLQQIT